jgi:multicomponent Na+:H+ antiporter subunit D
VTGGSVLRAGLRIFAGLGEVPDPGPDTHEEPEADRAPHGGWRVLAPPIALLVVAAALAGVPGVAGDAARAGESMTDRTAYVDAVLHGASGVAPAVPVESFWQLPAVALGLLAAALAVGFALAGLWPSGRPAPIAAALVPVRRGVRALHVVHRAHVGDYVSWVLVGFTVLGATLLLA